MLRISNCNEKIWDIHAMYGYKSVLETLCLYDSPDFQEAAHDAAFIAFNAGVPAETVRDDFEVSLTVEEFVQKCQERLTDIN